MIVHGCYNYDMRIIVGLGNPVPEYELTRHNAGKRAVQFLADQQHVRFERVGKVNASIAKLHAPIETLLVLPEKYMNESGEVVRAVLEYYKSAVTQAGYTELVVVYDDLDIVFGEYKLGYGTGPKVHNGVSSVIEQLGTDRFWHGRIGIDSRDGERLIPGRDYVLQRMAESEIMQLQQSVFPLMQREIDQKVTLAVNS